MTDDTQTTGFVAPADGQAIVYIREANREALPDHLKDAPGKMFSVHDPEGTCIAVAGNRKIAFALAKRNDMVPVSVH